SPADTPTSLEQFTKHACGQDDIWERFKDQGKNPEPTEHEKRRDVQGKGGRHSNWSGQTPAGEKGKGDPPPAVGRHDIADKIAQDQINRGGPQSRAGRKKREFSTHHVFGDGACMFIPLGLLREKLLNLKCLNGPVRARERKRLLKALVRLRTIFFETLFYELMVCAALRM